MNMMMHIINGYSVNLRACPLERLEVLATSAQARLDRAQEELDSLMGEITRRKHRYLSPIPSD